MQVMAHGAVHRHKILSIQAICMQSAGIKIKQASISKRDVFAGALEILICSRAGAQH